MYNNFCTGFSVKLNFIAHNLLENNRQHFDYPCPGLFNDFNMLSLGKVLKPLKSVNPAQSTYQGLIEYKERSKISKTMFVFKV